MGALTETKKERRKRNFEDLREEYGAYSDSRVLPGRNRFAALTSDGRDFYLQLHSTKPAALNGMARTLNVGHKGKVKEEPAAPVELYDLDGDDPLNHPIRLKVDVIVSAL